MRRHSDEVAELRQAHKLQLAESQVSCLALSFPPFGGCLVDVQSCHFSVASQLHTLLLAPMLLYPLFNFGDTSVMYKYTSVPNPVTPFLPVFGPLFQCKHVDILMQQRLTLHLREADRSPVSISKRCLLAAELIASVCTLTVAVLMVACGHLLDSASHPC